MSSNSNFDISISNNDSKYLSEAKPISSKSAYHKQYQIIHQSKVLNVLKQNDIAIYGWENIKEPWNEKVCKTWIHWGHILRHWPRTKHENLAKGYKTPLKSCKHVEYKSELNKAYKKFSKSKPTKVPYWLAAMVSAEFFLKREVDWKIFETGIHNANKKIQKSEGTRSYSARTAPPTGTSNHEHSFQYTQI